MVQVSGNFAQLVDFDPVLTEIFYKAFNQVPAQRQVVYGVRESTKAKETDLNIGSHRDPPEFKGKLEHHTVAPDFEVEYIPLEYADSFDVTRKMRDDMQYDGIFTDAQEMGTAFARFREKDAWSIFNNAFSGSYLGYDSKALCADDHPRSETDSTSVDNLSTLPLNDDNLEAVIVQLESLGDDRGEEISTVADLLIVPRALRKTAFQLVGSELTPEDANTAENIHMGLQFMVVPFLSSATAWFITDRTMSQSKLKWYNRVMTEFDADDDFNTFIRTYRAYMRYSRNWSNFRHVVGSTGAGS